MIREISSGTQMNNILSGHVFFEGCMSTAYECYHGHPSVAKFYKIGVGAVLMLMGKSALLCGEVKNTQELASFLHFSGVQSLKTDGVVPSGYTGEGLCLMRYKGGKAVLPPKSAKLETKLNLRRLSEGECFASCGMNTDEFYADACVRQARGLADIWALEHEGEYVSTAGVYSLQKNEAYISAVATSYAFRSRGYATFLTWSLAERYSDRQVVLVCEDKLRGFYERLGFVKESNIILCKIHAQSR